LVDIEYHLPPTFQVKAARQFISTVGETLEHAILSLGWTTVAHPSNGGFYSEAMVRDMHDAIREFADMSVAFTFAVRAQYVQPSWRDLKSLLEYPLTTFTLWAHKRPSPAEMAWFTQNLSPEKTLMDVGLHPSDDLWWKRVCTAAIGASFLLLGFALELTRG
jgi:hypothetical protein